VYIRIADERRAYALADLPIFGQIPGLALRPLFSADSALINRYTLFLVPADPPQPSARRFFRWALDTWRRWCWISDYLTARRRSSP
jgi:ABC-type tungstate transport system permease subunit